MGKMQDVSDNPYQAPAVQDVVAPVAPSTEAEVEAIRIDHLKHEVWLKGIGLLYLIGGVVVALSVVVLLAGGETLGARSAASAQTYWSLAAALVAASVGQFVTGWGLRRLRPWVKVPAAIFAGLSMLKYPVGPVIGGLILNLLFCAKGRTILSPGYADIIAQTPHLRYRTPRWIWIALGVILLLFVVAAIVGSRMG